MKRKHVARIKTNRKLTVYRPLDRYFVGILISIRLSLRAAKIKIRRSIALFMVKGHA